MAFKVPEDALEHHEELPQHLEEVGRGQAFEALEKALGGLVDPHSAPLVHPQQVPTQSKPQELHMVTLRQV